MLYFLNEIGVLIWSDDLLPLLYRDQEWFTKYYNDSGLFAHSVYGRSIAVVN